MIPKGQPLIGYTFQRHANGQLLVGAGGDYLASTSIGIIGDPNPKYKLSGINSLSYKSFTFRFQVDYTCAGIVTGKQIGRAHV